MSAATSSTAAGPAGAQPPAPVAHHVELVDLARVRESPFNPRLVFHPAEMAELEASIRERGVLQPIKVRPVKAQGKVDLEVVWGHRRHRASVAAGLAQIPAMIVAMSDEAVCDEQLVENHQRKDIHPLEEADQFARLHRDFKRTVAEIAKRIGLSGEYVYARMKLCALCDAGRKAFLDGKLTTSTALMVARVPDRKAQERAVRDLIQHADDGPLGARATSQHLQRNYMLRLVSAPFDVRDAKLVAGVPACTTCPKNSAQERALFADVDSKAGDLCTDPMCYQAKSDATFAVKAAEAKAAGAKVLEDSKAKELFYGDGRLAYGTPFVSLDDKCHDDPRSRTYRELLKKVDKVPTVLARDQQRQPHELVDRKVLPKLLEQAGHKFGGKGIQQSDAYKAEERKRREEDQRRRTGNAAVIAAVIDKATASTDEVRFLRLVLKNLLKFSVHDSLTDAIKRRGLAVKGTRAEELVRPKIDGMGAAELRGWILEITTLHAGFKYSGSSLGEVAKAYGIDAKTVAASAVKAEREAKADKGKGGKAKAPAKPAPKAPASPAKAPKTTPAPKTTGGGKTCPRCGATVSAANLARHQKSAGCKPAKK